MKRIFVLGIVFAMVLSFAGCGVGSPKEQEGSVGKITSEVKSEKQYIYGKVNSITGNDIEFQLAKDPGVDILAVDKEEVGEEKKENGKTEAATTTGAFPTGEEGKVSVGEIDKNKPLIDLELTDDKKNILIPIGININVLSEAKGEGLSAIKDGSYLRIEVDNKESDSPNVLSIDVIS